MDPSGYFGEGFGGVVECVFAARSRSVVRKTASNRCGPFTRLLEVFEAIMRLTMLGLLGIVALCALIVGTVATPNEWSLRLIGTTTALLVTIAFLTAVFEDRVIRAFAVGFLAGTCAYLVLAFYSDGYGRRYLLTDVTSQTLDETLQLSNPRTTPSGEVVHLLEGGHVHVTRPNRKTVAMSYDEAVAKGLMPYAYAPMSLPLGRHLRDIVHFASSLLTGVSMGAFAGWLTKRRQ